MTKKVSEMTQEEFIEYGKRLFLGWSVGIDERGNMLDKFSEDVEYIDLSVHRTIRIGKKEVEEALALWSGMSDWKVEITRAAAIGNHIALEWKWTAVHDQGPYYGIPPTGKTSKIEGTSWLTINEDGKICSERDYSDHATLLEQLRPDA